MRIGPRCAAALVAGLLACAARTGDVGVVGRRIYPTVAGGREWFLPDEADLNSGGELAPDQPSDVTIVRHGSPTVYHTDGVGPEAEIRLNVHSPPGKAWWRNVEMTAYYRVVAARGTAGPPHTELVAGATLNGSAIGTSYHGNLYFPPGVGSSAPWAAMEKELSHAQGYCGPRALVTSASLLPPAGEWFGEKLVVRNGADGTRVRLELWLDPAANDRWVKIAEYTDENGVGNDWSAAAIDGTDAAPYLVAHDQLLTWAGPYAGFRADNASLDFQRLSVREIAPF